MRKLLLMLVGLFFVSAVALAQRTITGKVTDEAGTPIASASVQVKGTNLGTITGENGNYSIAVGSNAKTLVFSYVNKEPKEVTISVENVINVILLDKASEEEEVVIIGYGSGVKKVDVTGAVGKVEGKVVQDKPSANMLDALQGKVSGVQIYTSSGEPSATPSVRIRGVGSLSGSNTPLYVLDGVPVSDGTIVSLNPNDIADVTVLKDPSTTSIYGSRAANGVILYTTKQGSVQKSRFSVSSQYGVSNLISTTKDVFNSFMNTKELTDFWIASGYRTQTQVDNLLAQYPNDTKWYKTYYKNDVPTYQLDMNLSGGAGKTTYYISGSYFNQEGLAYRSGFERYTLRANLKSSVNNWMKFGMNLFGGFDERETNPEGSNSTNRGLALLAGPMYSPVDANGKAYDYIPGWGRYHPNYLADKNPSLGKNIQLNPTAYVEINPIKNLVYKLQGGMDFYDYTSTSMRLPSYIAQPNNGAVSESFSRGITATITNTLEYKFNVNDIHNFTVLGGHEFIKNQSTGFSVSSNGHTDDRLLLIGAGPNNRDGSSSKSEYAFQSYFSRLSYNLMKKYMVDLSLRRDESSRFGRDLRGGTFWSAGLGWKAKKEDFFANVDWLSDLMVRASYGTSGNSPTSNYGNLATVGTSQYDGATTFGISAAGNPVLSWEEQKQFNFGFDAELFNRVNLTVDLYQKDTKGQLFNVPFPYTSGFSTILYNAGSIRNSGIDVELSADVYKTRDVSIRPFVSFNYNKDKVTELFQGRNYWVVPNTGVSYAVGQSVTFLYPIWAGVNPQTGDAQWYLPDEDPENFINPTKDPNRVTTVFNSAVLQQSTGIKRYAPFTGGYGFSASYKTITLDVNFSFASGKYLINNDDYFFLNPNQYAGFNQKRAILDYWKQPGDNARFPRYGVQFTQFDSRLIQDASFMRLKNITLGYALPKNVIEKQNVIKGASVSLTGRNLLTFTKYEGPDPEVDSNLSLGSNPNTRQVVIGLKLEF